MSETQSEQERNVDSIVQQMEEDAEEIERNYGRTLTVKQNESGLPLLLVNTDEDVVDEIATVIANEGYRIAYANFDEHEVAFAPRDEKERMADKFHTAVTKLRKKYDLTPADEFEAYSIPNGWQVHLPFIGTLSYEDISEPNNVLMRYNNVKIIFEGVKTGKAILRCEETTTITA